jgi:hypothetical protein
MSDTFTVTRSIDVNAPANQIFPHLVDFHNWEAWSPWEAIDPDMDKEYSGPDQGVGAVYNWSGNKRAGTGRMEIIEASEPSNVEVALDFVRPFKSSNTTGFHLQPNGDSTKVVWTMVGPITFMTKVMGIFKSMDRMIGPDFEKGPAQLKAVSENPA